MKVSASNSHTSRPVNNLLKIRRGGGLYPKRCVSAFLTVTLFLQVLLSAILPVSAFAATQTFNQPFADGTFTFSYDNANPTNGATLTAFTGGIDPGNLIDLVIPDSINPSGTQAYDVKVISSSVFLNKSGIQSLVLPNHLTSIGGSAFRGCLNLGEEIRFPATLTTMGTYAFSGIAIQREGSLVFEGATDGTASLTAIPDFAFDGSTYLTGDLIIPASVTSINGANPNGCAFRNSFTTGNGRLIFVDTASNPSQLTFIGQNSFYNATGLQGDLTIPASVVTISRWAFTNAFKNGTGTLTFAGTDDDTSSLTTIDDGAFTGATGLRGNLTIPKSVTRIGVNTFQNSFTTGSGALTFVGANDGSSMLASIGNNAFQNAVGLKGNLSIPASVETIGAYAFANSFTVGNGSLTFAGVDDDTNSLTSIGDYAFDATAGLTGNLTIPRKVKSIGGYAFRNSFTSGTGTLI
ncbi:MAG: leucine-rich repeat domain-containing protein, partial [Actinomycetes bacterium]|nr:leucine-rich repeat domain-containing protein [Actinomycetes bacterium]